MSKQLPEQPLSNRPMSDQPVSVPPVSVPPAPSAPKPITEFHIGDEFGTAKRNLPPAGIVLICIAAVAVVVAIIAFHGRAKPQGAGSIDFVAAAEVPNQGTVLVAITLTLRNTTDKSLDRKSTRLNSSHL